ncbi:XdhC family protein [Roseomonas acroporae]|uniref:XdhC family protein n=1 Tax=Roseomonas acroporae TaxID=2937791 RepID=UPI0031F578C0
MTPELLARLREAQAAKRPVALATRLTDGAQFLLPDDPASDARPDGAPGNGAPAALLAAARAAIDEDAARNVEVEGAAWFIHPHNPPLRLLVVGAVHIAQALVPMALQLGFAVTVIDPRRAFATEERFGRVTMIQEWPDDAMAALSPDSRTAVVTLTHDPKLDDPALDLALRSAAFYIGALGSRRTAEKRRGRLRELGHDDESMARIRGPVGLNIAAVTAPEIALSIIAEIVAVRRGAALGQPKTGPGGAGAAKAEAAGGAAPGRPGGAAGQPADRAGAPA